jgi:hypothetical protein
LFCLSLDHTHSAVLQTIYSRLPLPASVDRTPVLEMSSRMKRFFIFIAAAFFLIPFILLAIFDSHATYRQVPRSVPESSIISYRSPIPPFIHQNFFFAAGANPARYRPSKYQLSWQTSQFAYAFYTDAAALTLFKTHLPEFLPTFLSLPTPILKTDFSSMPSCTSTVEFIRISMSA